MSSSSESFIKENGVWAYRKKVYGTHLDLFTAYTFQAEENRPFIFNWHHYEIFDALLKIYYGQIVNLMILLPPQYGKSEIVKRFIAWCFARNPYCVFLYISASFKLINKHSNEIKQTIEHSAFQEFWPLEFDKSTKAKADWKIKEKGEMHAVPAKGQVTGFAAGQFGIKGFSGAVVYDDPHKMSDMDYPLKVDNVIRTHKGTVKSRKRGEYTPTILIAQRGGNNDLPAFLMENEPNDWYVLKIPILDKNDIPMWKGRTSKVGLIKLRENDPIVFSCQYMQNPMEETGSMFKKAWFQNFFDTLPDFKGAIYFSIDTAEKEKKTSDCTSIGVWGVYQNNYYLIDRVKKRMEFIKIKAKVIELVNKYKPKAILIEDKSSGTSLLSTLKVDTHYPCIAIQIGGKSKIVRAESVTEIVKAGKIILPKYGPWVADYVKEMTVFPHGKFDDDVDMTSQWLNWIHKTFSFGSLPEPENNNFDENWGFIR